VVLVILSLLLHPAWCQWKCNKAWMPDLIFSSGWSWSQHGLTKQC